LQQHALTGLENALLSKGTPAEIKLLLREFVIKPLFFALNLQSETVFAQYGALFSAIFANIQQSYELNDLDCLRCTLDFQLDHTAPVRIQAALKAFRLRCVLYGQGKLTLFEINYCQTFLVGPLASRVLTFDPQLLPLPVLYRSLVSALVGLSHTYQYQYVMNVLDLAFASQLPGLSLLLLSLLVQAWTGSPVSAAGDSEATTRMHSGPLRLLGPAFSELLFRWSSNQRNVVVARILKVLRAWGYDSTAVAVAVAVDAKQSVAEEKMEDRDYADVLQVPRRQLAKFLAAALLPVREYVLALPENRTAVYTNVLTKTITS
jgi:hypothetical protein